MIIIVIHGCRLEWRPSVSAKRVEPAPTYLPKLGNLGLGWIKGLVGSQNLKKLTQLVTTTSIAIQ